MSRKKNRKQRRKGRELRLVEETGKNTQLKGRSPRSIMVIEADINRHRVILRQSRLHFNYEQNEMSDLYEELSVARKVANSV